MNKNKWFYVILYLFFFAGSDQALPGWIPGILSSMHLPVPREPRPQRRWRPAHEHAKPQDPATQQQDATSRRQVHPGQLRLLLLLPVPMRGSQTRSVPEIDEGAGPGKLGGGNQEIKIQVETAVATLVFLAEYACYSEIRGRLNCTGELHLFQDTDKIA